MFYVVEDKYQREDAAVAVGGGAILGTFYIVVSTASDKERENGSPPRSSSLRVRRFRSLLLEAKLIIRIGLSFCSFQFLSTASTIRLGLYHQSIFYTSISLNRWQSFTAGMTGIIIYRKDTHCF